MPLKDYAFGLYIVKNGPFESKSLTIEPLERMLTWNRGLKIALLLPNGGIWKVIDVVVWG
jgi:hypothetical protein